MITVIHYDTNKDPDIYYGVDQKTENKILNALRNSWLISRSSADVWFGQDDSRYSIHHWDAKRKK